MFSYIINRLAHIILFKTFNWLNKYKACKAMNESHFFFFLLYVADLHNLKIEKRLRVMSRPKVIGVERANEARLEALAGLEVCFPKLQLRIYFLFPDQGGVR